MSLSGIVALSGVLSAVIGSGADAVDGRDKFLRTGVQREEETGGGVEKEKQTKGAAESQRMQRGRMGRVPEPAKIMKKGRSPK